jgi:hypothetical protein
MKHYFKQGKEYLKKDNFKYQGRSQRQYEDSAKIFLIAALGLFTLMAFSALYNLILG